MGDHVGTIFATRLGPARVDQRPPHTTRALLCNHALATPLPPSSHRPAMSPSSSLQWFLLALPAAVFFAYVLTAFPHASTTLTVHPSLATLPNDSASWSVYPETFYDGGQYVRFPQGTVSERSCALTRGMCSTLTRRANQVRYWLVGPEDGERVCLDLYVKLHQIDEMRHADRSNPWIVRACDHLERRCAATGRQRLPGTVVWYVLS